MTHLEKAAAQYAETRKAHQEAVKERQTFIKEFKKKHGYMYVTDEDFEDHFMYEQKQSHDKKVYQLRKEITRKEEALHAAADRFAQ